MSTGCCEFPEDSNKLPLRVQHQAPQQRVPGIASGATRPVQNGGEVRTFVDA